MVFGALSAIQSIMRKTTLTENGTEKMAFVQDAGRIICLVMKICVQNAPLKCMLRAIGAEKNLVKNIIILFMLNGVEKHTPKGLNLESVQDVESGKPITVIKLAEYAEKKKEITKG